MYKIVQKQKQQCFVTMVLFDSPPRRGRSVQGVPLRYLPEYIVPERGSPPAKQLPQISPELWAQIWDAHEALWMEVPEVLLMGATLRFTCFAVRC